VLRSKKQLSAAKIGRVTWLIINLLPLVFMCNGNFY